MLEIAGRLWHDGRHGPSRIILHGWQASVAFLCPQSLFESLCALYKDACMRKRPRGTLRMC